VNYRLDAFCEQIRLVDAFTDDKAARMAERNRAPPPGDAAA
jgi:hypothetical protein